MEVLELARWPVGGIRTYFRYTFGHERFREHRLTFVAPGTEVMRVLMAHMPDQSFRFVESSDSAIGLFTATAKQLASGRFKLVHSHGFTAAAIAAPLCRIYGVPHLMTAHDVFQPGQFPGLRGRVKRRVMEQALRSVDIIHTVTRDGRENMLAYLPSIDRSRIHTILHGIDVDGFTRAPALDFRNMVKSLGKHDFIIGFFGRFMAQKGFRYLVDAMDLLVNKRHLSRRPVVLTFGAGGYSREDYSILEQRGLGGYFLKLGHTDNMPGAIKGVDVVLMPSLWEACGLLAMEALAVGTPIIGSRCIGLREVMADSPARLVPPADATALADAIEDEMSAPRRQEFIDWMPQADRRFGRERPVEQLLELYDLATDRSRSGHSMRRGDK